MQDRQKGKTEGAGVFKKKERVSFLSAYVENFREVRLQVYKIVNKKLLNEAVVLVEVEAPFIAKKVLPGQFIIFRIDEQGERVPLTVADYDREKGTITLIVQMVGRSTKMLGAMEAGEYLLDVVGPLGIPTHLDGLKNVCVIGGGVGCAIAYPQAKALHAMGAHVDMIAGFRSKDIVIIEDEMRAVADNLYVMTDDGTYGEKGFTTVKLKELLEKAKADYDLLRSTITHTSSNDIEDTSPTFKVLEEGAATLSKEESGRLAQRQLKFIQHLEAALVRIENKSYGICRETGKLIPKERLRIVPHATLCIEAKGERR